MLITTISGGHEANRTHAIEETLKLLPTEHTNVLIIPTACSTPKSYNSKVPATEQFFKSLGLAATVLHEHGQRPTLDQIAHAIGNAALVYTIGGHTPTLAKEMRASGMDIVLARELRTGKPHSGSSAGALLPFGARHIMPNTAFEIIPGLSVLHGTATVHAGQYDRVSPKATERLPYTRLEALVATATGDPNSLQSGLGLGLENGTAVIFTRDGARIVRDPGEDGRMPQVTLLQTTPDGLRTEHISDDNAQALTVFLPQLAA